MYPITAILKLHRRVAKQSESLRCLRYLNYHIATSYLVHMDRNSLKKTHGLSFNTDHCLYAFLLPRM